MIRFRNADFTTEQVRIPCAVPPVARSVRLDPRREARISPRARASARAHARASPRAFRDPERPEPSARGLIRPPNLARSRAEAPSQPPADPPDDDRARRPSRLGSFRRDPTWHEIFAIFSFRVAAESAAIYSGRRFAFRTIEADGRAPTRPERARGFVFLCRARRRDSSLTATHHAFSFVRLDALAPRVFHTSPLRVISPRR